MQERPSIYSVPVVKPVFLMGVDLGQLSDPTAIVVAEMMLHVNERPIYHLRHLERPKLGTPYPAIVERVATLLKTPPLLAGVNHLIVDGTGVGVAVVDLLRQAGLRPVVITIGGGQNVTSTPGGFVVPKRDLAAILQVVLQTGRLKVADGMAEGATLIQELLNFHVKIDTATGHDSYEAWREGAHDDTVLAAAIAIWYGEQGNNQGSRTRSAY